MTEKSSIVGKLTTFEINLTELLWIRPQSVFKDIQHRAEGKKSEALVIDSKPVWSLGKAWKSATRQCLYPWNCSWIQSRHSSATRMARLKTLGRPVIHRHQPGCRVKARGAAEAWPLFSLQSADPLAWSSSRYPLGGTLYSNEKHLSDHSPHLLGDPGHRGPGVRGPCTKEWSKHKTENISLPRYIRPWQFCVFYLFVCLLTYS